MNTCNPVCCNQFKRGIYVFFSLFIFYSSSSSRRRRRRGWIQQINGCTPPSSCLPPSSNSNDRIVEGKKKPRQDYTNKGRRCDEVSGQREMTVDMRQTSTCNYATIHVLVHNCVLITLMLLPTCAWSCLSDVHFWFLQRMRTRGGMCLPPSCVCVCAHTCNSNKCSEREGGGCREWWIVCVLQAESLGRDTATSYWGGTT